MVNSGSPALVEFYAPWCGHCKSLAPKYKEAAKTLAGTMQLAAVDCDEHKSLAEKYGIKGFPTIKFFNGDGGVEDYNGPREVEGLVEFGKKKAGMGGSGGESKAVPNVEYLQAWNFLHRAPKPSVLLFGSVEDGKHAPGWLVTLALSYKETAEEAQERGGKTRRQKVQFGYVNADDDRVLARFGLSAAARPALLLLQPEAGRGGSYLQLEQHKLLSGMKSEVKENVKAFVDEHALVPLEPTAALEIPSFPEPSIPRKVKHAELRALSPETLDYYCYELKDKMCVIGVLSCSEAEGDGESCGAAAAAEAAVLTALSKKYRHDPLAFVSVRAEEQPEFAAAFGVQSSAAGGGSLVVVKGGKRARFAAAGLGDEVAAGAFLDRALGGELQFTRLSGGLPRLVETWERIVDEE